MRVIIGLALIFLLSACNKDSQVKEDIENLDLSVTIERFDMAFDKATPESFLELKENYPFLFSKQVEDSVYINRLNDSLQKIINSEIASAYPSESAINEDIELLFKHLKYYDKTFKTPRVITVSNRVDYRNKVVVTDSIVLIALDNYLGQDHEFYTNISKYIRQQFEADQVVVDLTDEYAKKRINSPFKKTLLAYMIDSGKRLYYKDVMIPFKTDAEKIGYTEEQLSWAQANEANIWSYMIENELLFSTDPKLVPTFINPAPFTKFGLPFDNESPGRLGEYIGWQIVKAYMTVNEVSLDQMLINNAEDIFNKSKFKPKK